MEIYKAHAQWNTRPADERFWTLADMQAACAAYKDKSVEKAVAYGDLRVEAHEGDVRLVGKANIPARLTHYAFGQLCARVGAPAAYLRDLPATLASNLVNHGLRHSVDQGAKAQLLMHVNGDYVLRSATSEAYERIWNADVAAALARLTDAGWAPPPGRLPWDEKARAGVPTRTATAEDARFSLNVRPGEEIAPAGVYASDKDMFAFLVHPDRVVDGGTAGGVPTRLMRGIMVWNSEVGDRSLGAMTFLFDGACGNHICWGARSVREIKIRHVGDAHERFAHAAVQIRKYADESASEVEGRIAEARTHRLGGTRAEALEALIGICATKRIDLGMKTLDMALAAAEREPRYGDPRTLWAAAQGLTEISQRTAYADARVKIDRATGKLLDAAF